MLRVSSYCLFVTLLISVSAPSLAGIQTNGERVEIKLGRSPIGNYLAGRHAQARHDVNAALKFLLAALKGLPNAPDLRESTFFLLVSEGRIKEALPLARKLIRENPKSPIANLTLAVEALRKRDYASVIARFKDDSHTGLNSFTQPFIKAWALAGQGKSDGAQEALAKLDRRESTKGFYDAHRALLLDFMNDPSAEAAYNALLDKDISGSFQVIQHIGQYYERHGQIEKARAIYDRSRSSMPGTTLFDVAYTRLKSGVRPLKILRSASDGVAAALFTVANSLRLQRAKGTALALVRLALHLRPNFGLAMVLVAEILEEDKRYADANVVYERVALDSPFRTSSDLGLAKNLGSLGQTDRAIALYTEISNRRSHDPEPLIQLGNLLRRLKRWEDAIKVYTDAIARIGIIEKRFWHVLYARGIAYERGNRWPDAERDLLDALKFKPEQPFILNYIGYSWIDQGIHLKRAQKMIRRAAELRPDDGYIIDSLGWGYYKLGKYEEAVKELERSIEIRPEDPIINDHLGDAYWRVGRRLEARFQWRRSLSLDPKKDLDEKIRKKLKFGLGVPNSKEQQPYSEKDPVGGGNPSVRNKI